MQRSLIPILFIGLFALPHIAQAGHLEFEDTAHVFVEHDRDVLAEAAQTWSFDTVVLITDGAVSKDAFYRDIERRISSPTTVSIGVDVGHHHTAVFFGRDLQVPRAVWESIFTIGNPFFKERRWGEGVKAIGGRTERAIQFMKDESLRAEAVSRAKSAEAVIASPGAHRDTASASATLEPVSSSSSSSFIFFVIFFVIAVVGLLTYFLYRQRLFMKATHVSFGTSRMPSSDPGDDLFSAPVATGRTTIVTPRPVGNTTQSSVPMGGGGTVIIQGAQPNGSPLTDALILNELLHHQHQGRSHESYYHAPDPAPVPQPRTVTPPRRASTPPSSSHSSDSGGGSSWGSFDSGGGSDWGGGGGDSGGGGGSDW